jgi:hypothetical protein
LHGPAGTGLFQSLYQPADSSWSALTLMPEWYLLLSGLGALAVLGTIWRPLLLASGVLSLALAATLGRALVSAWQAPFREPGVAPLQRFGMRSLTALLFVIQPLARLSGRLRHGLTPWRHRGPTGFVLPWPRQTWIWSERWRSPDVWLDTLERLLEAQGARVRRAGDFDRWDLEVHGGILGATRVRLAAEEHGAGRQLIRFHLWPRWKAKGLAIALVALALAAAALLDHALLVAGCLIAFGVAHLGRTVWELGTGMATMHQAILGLASEPTEGSEGAGANTPAVPEPHPPFPAVRQPRNSPRADREVASAAASRGRRPRLELDS